MGRFEPQPAGTAPGPEESPGNVSLGQPPAGPEPDVEIRAKTMTTEEKALMLIRSGKLKLRIVPGCTETSDKVEVLRLKPWSGFCAGGRWVSLVLHKHPKTGRRRVKLGNTYVYLNRLVWMATRDELPPERVDHKDGDRFNDSPDNLQAHTPEESNRQGLDVQTSLALNECLRFFESAGTDEVSESCPSPLEVA